MAPGLKALCDVFRAERTPELRDAYFKALGYLSLEDWDAVVGVAVAGYKFMPKPAELLEAAYHIESERKRPGPAVSTSSDVVERNWRKNYLRGRIQVNEFFGTMTRLDESGEMPHPKSPQHVWLEIARGIMDRASEVEAQFEREGK